LEYLTKLPEVFPSTSLPSSANITRLVNDNLIKKIGPRLYTKNLLDKPEVIVVRNIWNIVGIFAPGAVVSHRTALENRPSPEGIVFISGAYARTIKLPGLIIKQLEGPDATDTDLRYLKVLFLASTPRAFLENLMPSRERDQVSKTVGRAEIERRVTQIQRNQGSEELIKLLNDAKKIAPKLNLNEEYEILNEICESVMRIKRTRLYSPEAIGIAATTPYDANRSRIFDGIFANLSNFTPILRTDDSLDSDKKFSNIGFFDAYFSNYIEGTEFTVDEAMAIIFDQQIPALRPQDAKDILGTYRLSGNRHEMTVVPSDFEHFISLIKTRHSIIMAGRSPEIAGKFKTKNNKSGGTDFVDYDLVIGTLSQGYQRYEALKRPFSKALFMMFMIAEVHPFADGNGRLARVMMNAELISARQTRIIIPSVYRREYISSLNNLSQHNDSISFIRVMDYAQNFVSRCDVSDFDRLRAFLKEQNAFHDPDNFTKLIIPGTEQRQR
jgi:Fic family protein